MTDFDPTTADLRTVDLMDERWYAAGPPHELFARMRADAPVRWNPSPDGSGFWSVTRHADIAYVSKHPELFSSAAGGVFLHPDQGVPLELNRNMILFMDPPDHTKYRNILRTAFTARSVNRMEESIRLSVTRLLDQVVGDGRCDWVTQVAVPLPLNVLISMMSLPQRDIDRLYDLSGRIGASIRAPGHSLGLGVVAELNGYLSEQVSAQIAEGVDDSLVMRLRSAVVEGESLTDDELSTVFGLLIFAGNDTTRNTAAAGLDVLLDHPDQWRRLVENPSLIGSAVEELLRYTSVVQFFKRTALSDAELGGERIRAGDPIILWYASGSRDESVYDDPDRFDIARERQDHMTFGGGGNHFCMGAGLARRELSVLLEEATRRIPDLHRDGPIERLPWSWANVVSSVPIRFNPSTTSERGAQACA